MNTLHSARGKRGFFLVLTGLCVWLLLAACSLSCARKEKTDSDEARSGAAGAPFKVGLVFDVGGRGDKSFNDSAYRGLVRAKEELGVSFEYIEPGEGSDRASALRLMAKGDARVVFGIGFLFTDDITQTAKEFPDKKFACVDYTVTDAGGIPANLVALKFREEEGSFLIGAIAALKSKTGKLGFVGGMKIPLIKKFEAGYVAGATYVRPDVKVLVSYAGVTDNAFKNPSKGKELALTQYSKGADVIFHASGSTGLGVFEAARERGKLAIGVDSDQYAEAPGYILTSMIKDVDVAVLETIRAAMNGTFEGGVRTLGLKEGGINYVYDDNNKALIGEDVRAAVETLKQKIISGEIVVPST
ncbi:MAG: BMP family ABC transporter substrate-binding protein [Candidatus Eisenbacteria bacterium]|nr:BMP family ABC transporter substrate-binding protein [Candidatus Eisenbacteria bacterium]